VSCYVLLHVPAFGSPLDLCPTVLITPNGFKTRLMVYSCCQRGLEILSLCRCNDNGSTFFSVVFKTLNSIMVQLCIWNWNLRGMILMWLSQLTWQQNVFSFSCSISPVKTKALCDSLYFPYFLSSLCLSWKSFFFWTTVL